MTKEDYMQYYIQGSDHYLIPKDIFDELYDEMKNWKQDTQKYKEVIDKAIETLQIGINTYNNGGSRTALFEVISDSKDILKEVNK